MKFTSFEKRWLPVLEEDLQKIGEDFDRLAKIEPRLAFLLEEVRAFWEDHQRFREHFEEIDVWYRRFKPALSQLVGWSAPDDPIELRSSAAYDTVYRILYAAIPVCRCRKCTPARTPLIVPTPRTPLTRYE